MLDQIHPWLEGGEASTPTLSRVADFTAVELSDNNADRSVCDLGCGNGDLLLHLRRHGWLDKHLYGCDIEPTHVALARDRTGLDTIIEWDAASCELPSGWDGVEFAAVIAMNWLHNDWRYRHAINVTPHQQTDLTTLSRVLWNVRRLSRLGTWFIWDYRLALPQHHVMPLRDWVIEVRNAGFAKRHVEPDVRRDGSTVQTWYWQLVDDKT